MNSDIPRLGVNIDHVATLRQARGEGYPSIVDAASKVFQNGADQITIHLREDRRHIQDTDVEAVHLVTKKFGKPLNLEMGANEEIIEIAIATGPDWVCLVPEKREEQTTEGGLNLKDEATREQIDSACSLLKEKIPGVKISLFVEANLDILKASCEMSIDAVEIHTGDYAKAILNDEDPSEHIEQYIEAKAFLKEKGIGCHAGHGLTLESVKPLLKANLFEEYNIGHWIICQAVFDGLGPVVKELKTSFENWREL